MLELMQSWPIGDFGSYGKIYRCLAADFLRVGASLVFPFAIAALGPLIGVQSSVAISDW